MDKQDNQDSVNEMQKLVKTDFGRNYIEILMESDIKKICLEEDEIKDLYRILLLSLCDKFSSTEFHSLFPVFSMISSISRETERKKNKQEQLS